MPFYLAKSKVNTIFRVRTSEVNNQESGERPFQCEHAERALVKAAETLSESRNLSVCRVLACVEP